MSFWAINLGLTLMVLISVLPVGLAWFVLGLKTGWSITDQDEPLFERAKQEDPELVTVS